MEDKNMLTAAEPMMAQRMTSYADVMNYLHTIHISPEDKRKVANRLTLEVTGKNLSRIFERLDYLSTLPTNWDGYGALRISRKVIDNIRKVLLISEDEDWENWLIGAESNATIALQSRKNRASISIGNDEYSYYALLNGERLRESHIGFSPNKFLDLMRTLNQ